MTQPHQFKHHLWRGERYNDPTHPETPRRTKRTHKTVQVKKLLRRFLRKVAGVNVAFNSKVVCLFPDSTATTRSGNRNPVRERIAERIRLEE